MNQFWNFHNCGNSGHKTDANVTSAHMPYDYTSAICFCCVSTIYSTVGQHAYDENWHAGVLINVADDAVLDNWNDLPGIFEKYEFLLA